MFKKRFEKKLIRYVREFFVHHPDVKLVAVTGSAGKLSTKMAIATVLSQKFRVAMHEEAPRSVAETLLQIMGILYPDEPESRWGFWARRRMMRAVKKRSLAEYQEAQVIVQEFNPIKMGYNIQFKPILSPDIAVITSVTSGRLHVDYSLEHVAVEMLTLGNNAQFAIINRDDIEGRFAAYLTNPHLTTYGMDGVAEYFFEEREFSPETGHSGRMVGPEFHDGMTVSLRLFGEYNLRPAIAAVAVAARLGLDEDTIVRGLSDLRPLPGRMQLLPGADNTLLIDDSYSSSPSTAIAALQSLYGFSAPQKIAVLGNINGLRGALAEEMSRIGDACNAAELDWVVTVGEAANQFIAPAARRNGCQVKECQDAIQAGGFVRQKLHAKGVALFKGSSGGVWLEEAIKINLRSTSDERKLVRQSPAWLARKNEFFSRFSDN